MRLTCSEVIKSPYDVIGDGFGRLMFPVAPNSPPALTEHLVGAAVSGDVPVQLLRPPVCVGRWPGGMLGTSVPEAPINEDRQSGTTPRDVSASTQILLELYIGSKPDSTSVEYLAQCHFGVCVP